jgi:DNA-binding response OmpR family regulator
MTRVLVVDSDNTYRDAVCAHLSAAGMDTRGIAAGAQLDPALAQGPFDVVLCEVDLPDESGFSVAARLRLVSASGLVLLTKTEKREDRILALTVGVDHYLVKPEDLRELEMLVVNLHKRANEGSTQQITGGAALPSGWTFDAARWTLAAPEGGAVPLSRAEHLLLGCLLGHIGEVVTRDELLDVLDRRDVRVYSRNVDMIISRLRRKVARISSEKLPILSARGIGYVFTGPGKLLGEAAAPPERLRR